MAHLQAQRAKVALGARAETIVCEYLEARGYVIVGRNVRVGRKEIDIIASRARTLVVCEVRARRRVGLVAPLETIGPAKVRNVRRAAQGFVDARPAFHGFAIRFDAAGVTFDRPEGTIDYREDAF